MKLATCATAITAVFVVAVFYCTTVSVPAQHSRVIFAAVNDHPFVVTVNQTGNELPSVAVNEPESEPEQISDGVEDEAEYIPEIAEQTFYNGTGDGFMEAGIRTHDGRVETWYSSNQAYHVDTAQWTADEEGYYRDDQGRYVVAASDIPLGTEFETSKGKAVVLDDGCAEGVTDFYTQF